MYNRYIPQPDGTYRRNRIQDPQRQPPAKEPPQPCPPPQMPCQEPPQAPQTPPPYTRPAPQRKRKNPSPISAGSFLRQLLPSDFDTEDLLVVVLLLLMAGDCQEDRSNALLTLALYMFL